VRRARAGLLAVLVAVAAALSASAPTPVLACSCEPWRPLSAYANDPAHAIFSGRVAAGPSGHVDAAGADATAYDFAVERWFWGPDPAPVVLVASIGELGCGLELAGGEHLIMVAWRHEQGAWMPSICTPWADADSPDGVRMLADAAATFGSGLEPDPPPERAPVAPEPFFLLGLVLTGLLFAVAPFFARRR
jgi:hypothetical protein